MRKLLMTCAVAAVLATTAGMASAHHSMAIYEIVATTVEGTVQEFKYVNPHSIILLKVTGANGSTAIWYLEGDPPAALSRDGFSRDMFRPGDRIKLLVQRFRSGQNGGLWGARTILQQNGHEFAVHQCMNSPDRCGSH